MKLKKSNKYFGVYYNSKTKKWLAIITNNLVIGEYLFEESAARAYDKKAITHFGKRAKLNFEI